jgi:uncharacterized protein YtpQ (UPF0354 family)
MITIKINEIEMTIEEAKELRVDAILYVVKEKLVRVYEKQSTIGRSPAYIVLTEKGQERVSEISRTPRHTSVWNV